MVMLEHLRHLSLHLRKGSDLTVERIHVCGAHQVHLRINSAKGRQNHLLDHLNRLSMLGQANLLLYLDRSRARSGCGRRVANQAGRERVLDLHPLKRKLEHRLHRLDIWVAPASSAHSLTFGLKVLLCQPPRQAAGKESQVLCNRVHRALPDKRVLNDLPAMRPTRDLERYNQKQMVRRQVRPPVQRFLQTQGSDGSSSSSNSSSNNCNKTNHRMHSRCHHNIDSSCLSGNLLPIGSSHQSQISPHWKQHNQTGVDLDLHALKTVNSRLLRVVLLQPRSILVMRQQSAE